MVRASLAFSLTLSVILTGFFSGIFAQSGRGVPLPQQTPYSPTASPKQPSFNRSSFYDAGLEEYRLIFPISYEGKLKYSKKGKVDFDALRRSRLNNFTEQLNIAGKQGYRLTSVVNGWNPVGIVKLDEAQYEYASFETNSHLEFVKVGFEQQFSGLAMQGFRVVHQIRTFAYCEQERFEDGTIIEECDYDDLFLLEKIIGDKKTSRQTLIQFPHLRWPGDKPSVALSSQINERLTLGFFPVSVFSQLEILLEEVNEKDADLANKPDVQIVRSPDGRNQLKMRVNTLAGQGYRMALTNNGVALLYRDSKQRTAVSYTWLDTAKRNMMMALKGVKFEDKLAKLQQSGAVYRMTYPNKQGDKSTLIFEQSTDGNKEQREYRILQFDFDVTEKTSESKLNQNLTERSKESITIMNSLVKDGFEVRDLFVSEKVSMILERVKQ